MNTLSFCKLNTFYYKKGNYSIDIIDWSNLVSYYPFRSSDVSGTTIANWATGSPVYDASMTGTTTIENNQMSTLTAGTTKNGIMINRNVLPTGFTGLSFSFWFSATSLAGGNYPFLTTLQDAVAYPSGVRYYISINPSKYITINSQMNSSTLLTVNTLYHIAIVITSTGSPNTTLYINNVSQTGTTTYPTFTNASGYNSISRDPAGDGLIGTIDDYGLHKRALTAGEVNTSYLAGRSS